MSIKGSTDATIEANFQLLLKGTDYTLKYKYANAVFNLVLTLVIAGRIWFIGTKTQVLMGYSQQSHIICNKYKTIFAVSLEAGIVYPISLILHAAITGNTNKISIPVDLAPTAIQLAVRAQN
ncbi:hypothetical protein K435DRAFT_664386 [Dendrothele bispora CBS 962.96]|uniref:Uncharacterized protein n=1 Tax=Dendrothele bispora (strain CBS 962.96) TaxID=1314807 RepID=A0A4S8M324_DENBC|nr:hypothetical protein K435DRAFT_664386 [Dendrothele bispora CBS 962.96]